MKKLYGALLVLALSIIMIGCNFGSVDTTQTTVTTLPVITDVFIDINSVDELKQIEMNKSYRLTADLDISAEDWLPLGTYAQPYLGIFDGNGHTIDGLNIESRNDNFNGLFGYLSGEVRDLSLTNINIEYQSYFVTYVGGIAGYTDGNIVDSTVSGDISINNTSSNSYIGLLTGFSQAKIGETTLASEFVPNSLSGNSVSGSISLNEAEIAYVGGLVGKTYNTTVNNNLTEVDLNVVANSTSLPIYVGGFIGHNYGGIMLSFPDEVTDPNIYIENNINLSNVTVINTKANVFVGGFMAFNQKGFIRDNFSKTTLNLEGTKAEDNNVRIGGFLAENFEANVQTTVSESTLDISLFTGQVEANIFIAGEFSEFDYLDIYIYDNQINDNFVNSTDPNVNYINQSDLTSNDFYNDDLSWSTEFINLIINALEE